MRQIALDTETTGLAISQGHRIIEIGCIEMVNRRFSGREYHRFLNPEREIDAGAEAVHGISGADLENQPRFSDIVDEFLEFIKDGELIIHNADFDIGFLEYELELIRHPKPKITQHAVILDTLSLARKLHPGRRNNLDALCKRYDVDNSRRNVHGALIDAELLAKIYLCMTGGQTTLSFDQKVTEVVKETSESYKRTLKSNLDLIVIKANEEECAAHEELLDKMEASGECIWRNSNK
ncbi:DNA polymerase III subunit epsilon [Woeseiaceae bacterium]|jgi:DNA polymerase-3 subunit epsilon|nr:DNA polymerase III subunit epsilon [Woeseiaceae bacterium]